jgi:hypothetical protein
MIEKGTKEPTPAEIGQAAEVISRIESPIPTPVFTEMARLVATPLIELIPFKIIEGKLHVRMIPRPEGDIVWPGMVHVPGSAFRPGEGLEDVFERLFQGELDGANVPEINYAGMRWHRGERGHEMAWVCHYLENEETSSRVGEFYPIDDLPKNAVESQLPMIYAVADRVIKEMALEPLDPQLPRDDISTFEELLAQYLASFAN